LEQEIQILEEKVKKLQSQTSDSERLRNSALEACKITKENLKWYSEIKQELEKRYGIPVDNISKLAAIVNQLSLRFGYDASKVIDALSNLESLKAEHAKYQSWIQEVKTDYYGLNHERSQLQNIVVSFNQSLSVYNQLYDMNVGLKELKLLWNTILEIAAANNIPREQAVSKFFKDIENEYDDKLGFQSKIDKLQIEVNKLGQRELKLLGEINAIPRLAIGVVKLLNMHHDDSKNSIEEIELLIDQVQRCGGINAAINKLSQSTEDEKERREEEQRLTDNYDDDPTEAQFRSMIKRSITQVSLQILLLF
jgi:hypothetical protein